MPMWSFQTASACGPWVRCILARYEVPFRPNMHIRCIAYVINLVVQALLIGIDEGVVPEKEN